MALSEFEKIKPAVLDFEIAVYLMEKQQAGEDITLHDFAVKMGTSLKCIFKMEHKSKYKSIMQPFLKMCVTGTEPLKPKINKWWWEWRTTLPLTRIMNEPKSLWQAAEEYFDFVSNNPMQEQKVFHHQGEITKTGADKMRVMSIDGFCIFLDIIPSTWYQMRKKEEFAATCSKIESVIKAQKFAGAAADLFNANFIARDLSLMDNVHIEAIVGKHEMTLEEVEQELLKRGIPNGN
jgi:hypothetical protein